MCIKTAGAAYKSETFLCLHGPECCAALPAPMNIHQHPFNFTTF